MNEHIYFFKKMTDIECDFLNLPLEYKKQMLNILYIDYKESSTVKMDLDNPFEEVDDSLDF